MCTRYTTRRVETTVAESLNNQLFNICERQLSLFSTVKPMTMKINARSGFVPTKRAANPRRPQKKKKKCEDAPSFQMAWERGPTLLCCVLSTAQLSSQDQDALGRIKIQNQNQATSSELIRK